VLKLMTACFTNSCTSTFGGSSATGIAAAGHAVAHSKNKVAMMKQNFTVFLLYPAPLTISIKILKRVLYFCGCVCSGGGLW
jgi:hypothetical protein